MIRRIVPILAVAAVLGACSSNSTNMPEPGAPNTTRAADRGTGGGRGGNANGGRMLEAALRGITLSSDQQRRIDDIRASYRSQMEQAGQGGNMDRGAMRTMMERQQSDIRNVLTSDQQAQFDRNVAQMREQMQQGGGRRPNG